MEPRIVDMAEMKVVGVAFNPELHGWQFVPTLFYGLARKLALIQHKVQPETLYGVIYPSGGGPIDTYLACVEVSEFGELPDGCQAYTVPAGSYAVFTIRGGLGDMQRAYGEVNTWLPASAYKEARCGAVEVYDERFVPSGLCEFDVRVAVVSR